MTTKHLLAICILLNHAGLSSADDQIAPYVEPTTMLVARVDLSRVDPPALFQFLQEQLQDSQPAQLLPARAMAVAYVQALRDAKVENLYITLSTIDCLTANFAVLVPSPEPDRVASVLEAVLPQIPPHLKLSIHRSPGMIALASAATWERLSAKPAANRPELITAMTAQAGHSAALTFNLHDRMRSEIAEIWPDKLPPQVPFEASPKSLIADIRSLTLTLDLPPTPAVRLSAVTVDAAAAARVQITLTKATSLVPVTGVKISVDNSEVIVDVTANEIRQALGTIAKPLRAATSQNQASNSLKQIVLAMHNFHDKYGFLPPRETRSPDGKPLLSWRVFLLPYLEQDALYKQFRLNEPWDSPHNRPLADKMPGVYRGAAFLDLPVGHTCFQLPILPGGTWFGDGLPKSFRDITDGMSNTISVVVADRDKAVIWTKPEELNLRPEQVVQDLFGARDSLPFAYFDGSIRPHKRDVSPEVLTAIITSAGGERIEAP